jgi:ABC-type multidrug transport system permease subunit
VNLRKRKIKISALQRVMRGAWIFFALLAASFLAPAIVLGAIYVARIDYYRAAYPINVSSSLHKVVETEGSDIDYLMDALKYLYKVYAIQFGVLLLPLCCMFWLY